MKKSSKNPSIFDGETGLFPWLNPSGDWEPASSGGMWPAGPAGPAWPATRQESNADDGMTTMR